MEKSMHGKSQYKEAKNCASNNRDQILNSKKCGCFYCLAIFHPSLIKKWIDVDDSQQGQTATCPYCNMNTIIGDAFGYKITLQFLHGMYKTFFRKKVID